MDEYIELLPDRQDMKNALIKDCQDLIKSLSEYQHDKCCKNCEKCSYYSVYQGCRIDSLICKLMKFIIYEED